MSELKQQVETLRASIDILVRVLKITDRLEILDCGVRLNPSDTQALLHIRMNAQCISAEIGQLLNVVPTTTSTIVDRLVNNGLVQRERTDLNRRVVLLSLTQRGEKIAQKILEEQRLHCRLMLEVLGAGERLRFVNSLEKIASEIDVRMHKK